MAVCHPLKWFSIQVRLFDHWYFSVIFLPFSISAILRSSNCLYVLNGHGKDRSFLTSFCLLRLKKSKKSPFCMRIWVLPCHVKQVDIFGDKLRFSWLHFMLDISKSPMDLDRGSIWGGIQSHMDHMIWYICRSISNFEIYLEILLMSFGHARISRADNWCWLHCKCAVPMTLYDLYDEPIRFGHPEVKTRWSCFTLDFDHGDKSA